MHRFRSIGLRLWTCSGQDAWSCPIREPSFHAAKTCGRPSMPSLPMMNSGTDCGMLSLKSPRLLLKPKWTLELLSKFIDHRRTEGSMAVTLRLAFSGIYRTGHLPDRTGFASAYQRDSTGRRTLSEQNPSEKCLLFRRPCRNLTVRLQFLYAFWGENDPKPNREFNLALPAPHPPRHLRHRAS